MEYKFCGRSGLRLPVISLGLWHNFGATADFDTAERIILHAFDKGITHFDLVNKYGSPLEAQRKISGKYSNTS